MFLIVACCKDPYNLMKTNALSEIVGRAMGFMRSAMAQDITIPQIAAKVNYSPSHLNFAFKAVTGESVKAQLSKLRLEKAKEMLRKTNMDITAIAFESGFNSYTRFAIAFRKMEKCSPSVFRKAAAAVGENPVHTGTADMPTGSKIVFHDKFPGRALGGNWRAVKGTWRQRDGWVEGTATEDCLANLEMALPENFEISFDVQFDTKEGGTHPNLEMKLCNQNHSEEYCVLGLGGLSNRAGSLHRWNQTTTWSPRAVFSGSQWQHVVVELKEDLIRVFIGEEVLSYRDPFPTTFSSRSRFSLGSWGTTFMIRDFVIRDFGFRALERTVRQGDSLFNAGLYENARDFYVRCLRAESSPDDVLELRYKIGMCSLRHEAFSQARLWFDKVVGPDGDNFWELRAKLALLEIDRIEYGLEVFKRKARALYEKPAARGDVWETIRRTRADLSVRGFHRQVIDLYAFTYQLEEENTIMKCREQIGLLVELCRAELHQEALRHIQEVCGSPIATEGMKTDALVALANIQSARGEFDESDNTISSIQQNLRNPFGFARTDCIRAINARGREQLDKALELFRGIRVRHSTIDGYCAFSAIHEAYIQGMIGKHETAMELMLQNLKEYPKESFFLEGNRSEVFHVPLLMAGRVRDAADVLLTKPGRYEPAMERAEREVKAGILIELAGDKDRARNQWRETSQRYPSDQCCISHAPNFFMCESVSSLARISLEGTSFDFMVVAQTLRNSTPPYASFFEVTKTR